MNRKTVSAVASSTFLLVLIFGSNGSASEPWAADIDHFRSAVFDADKSYSPAQRQEAEVLLARLEADFMTMSDEKIELALARISALTNNGHSFLMPGGWTERYARLPISFRVFADGIFVISAGDGFSHLIGNRLESIEGRSVAELREAWKNYQGGVAGWRDLFLPYFLETPAILHAAGYADSSDILQMSLTDKSGTNIDAEIPAVAGLPPLEGMDLYIAPSRLLVDSSSRENRKLPLYLRSPGQVFRFEMLENPTAAYIQFKANTDFTGTREIDIFLADIRQQLGSSPSKFIILDQRFNFGGDLNNTRKLMQALPGYLEADGKIFVITSGRTFSAGISSVGYLVQAAGDRALIVGEPIGDELEFWAEGGLQILPNSGVAFLMASERHNYRTGCPEDDCHGSIKRHPIRVDTLQPDIHTPLRYADYERGIDPAMEAIQQYISGND